MGTAYIQGVQSENVIATAKHFACNNQEFDRTSVDVRIDERALHEIYLPALIAFHFFKINKNFERLCESIQ